MSYDHKNIEKKWQKIWQERNTFKTENDFSKPGFYCLDMFPYPSGAGLHVGHPKGFVGNDVFARYKHARGYNVLHPMGWDAFGLPAENYAIKTGIHPKIKTEENVQNYRRQMDILGFSYDRDREINTTDPSYYKRTQWIFLKMFEKGLAYEQDLPINYCPSCKTGLANEEVLNDFTCDRCGTKVEKRKIRQWVLAITKYADRLANDVDNLDRPEGIKQMQKNWIGRSEGVEFDMKKSDDASKKISVYTTRIDTVFGMTYAVLAPDHPQVLDFITPEKKQICEKYIEDASKKSDQDRTQDDKEKTGVFTGTYVLNPFNNEKVPLWIGDYVLGNYGTGAVMAVPAHDERDFEFAKKYDLDILPTIFPENLVELFKKQEDEKFQEKLTDEELNALFEETEKKENHFNENLPFLNTGFIGNIPMYLDEDEYNANDENIFSSEEETKIKNNRKLYELFFGLTSKQAQEKLTKLAEEQGFGTKKVNYKLRDWLFSRQRYWGEPIPLIHLNADDVKKLSRIQSLQDKMEENTAYVLKKQAEQDTDSRTLCSKGQERSLVINGKIVSKIYKGIYGDIICDYNLPLKLPDVERYEPAGDGNSPLALIEDFVNVKLAENLSGKRETNTMPQWGGSCWYYLRFMDPHNNENLLDPEVEKYRGNVDNYVGGAEHAVLHLLYARFWHKFLFDIKKVSSNEPFKKLVNQGMIQAFAYKRKNGGLIANDLVEEKNDKYFAKETGEELDKVVAKMSKSLKNVVNPDTIVEEYGADTFRMYEMYMSEFRDSAPWDTKGIVGVRRFLDKVYKIFKNDNLKFAANDDEAMKLLHKTIKKAQEDIENYKFNTAIAQFMILVNYGVPSDEMKAQERKEILLKLIHPFAPHLADELWASLGNENSIFHETWPAYNEQLTIDDELEIAVQVMGKLRGTIIISANEDKTAVLAKAKKDANVSKFLEGKQIIKEIYVPGKIVNLVVK